MKHLLWHLPHNLRRSCYKLLKQKSYQELNSLKSKESSTDSLKPFIQRRAIFVHIPKTAGISVCEALFGSLSGGHKRIREYSIAFKKEEFNSFYKFAFVRHPADRLCSAFHYLKKGGRTDEDAQFGQETLSKFDDVNEFVDKWLEPDRLYSYLHFVPQYEFLRLTGTQIQADFIGKFETLEQDFSTIAKKLNLSVELPKLNSSRRNLTWQDQLSKASREKIAAIYATDYSLFEYSV